MAAVANTTIFAQMLYYWNSGSESKTKTSSPSSSASKAAAKIKKREWY